MIRLVRPQVGRPLRRRPAVCRANAWAGRATQHSSGLQRPAMGAHLAPRLTRLPQHVMVELCPGRAARLRAGPASDQDFLKASSAAAAACVAAGAYIWQLAAPADRHGGSAWPPNPLLLACPAPPCPARPCSKR